MKNVWMLAIVGIMATVIIVSGCGVKEVASSKPVIAVSIVPQETFVKAVAGDLVDVVTLIPPGASPANYQPSPKEMTAFSKADIYFTIGVGAEEANIIPNIAEGRSDLDIVALAPVVDAIYPARYFNDEEYHEDEDTDEEDHEDEDDHDHEGRDPHTWMSPKRVQVMVKEIRDVLSSLDPDNASVYEANAESYIESLVALDQEVTEQLSGLVDHRFIVMHPSLGYFAEDYGLEMVAIEEDGKEASVAHLQKVIDYGREHDIPVVFYQQEFDSSQAKTIAKELDGTVISYEPLTDAYIEGIKKLAETFMDLH